MTAILFNFKSKFAQSSIVSYFRVIFYVFYDYRKLFMSLFFTKFVKLDPDPHGSALILPPGSGSAFRKTAGSRSAKNECGSTALDSGTLPVHRADANPDSQILQM